MSKPVLAVGLLAAMVGAWYWALRPAAPSASPRGDGTLVTAPADARDVPVVRLDDLTARTTPGLTPGYQRNPFSETAEPAAVSPATPASRPAAATGSADPAGAPLAAAWPRLELIGLAETRDDGSLVRTAIVSGPQGVLHAKPGDVLEGVYRLERIGVDAVEVRLMPEDRILRLPLRR